MMKVGSFLVKELSLNIVAHTRAETELSKLSWAKRGGEPLKVCSLQNHER